jgi:protein gp37
MSDKTAISWCDATWSPWEGCTKVSPACDHCYAERMNRWLHKGENWGPGAPRREYGEDHWDKPARWNATAARTGKQVTVFPSVCDPFDNEVDETRRMRFFRLILDTPHLTWLLLTKRVGNVAKMLDAGQWDHLTNVWLGATVVNQEEADRDVPKLLAVPARVRFLSIEPMLGPVNLTAIKIPLEGQSYVTANVLDRPDSLDRRHSPETWLDWIIAGGESGPHARPAHPDWFRSLRDQCAAAGVPFHFKQWGEWASVSEVEGAGQHFIFNDHATVRRVGRAAAGRRLDGVEHNGFPV